MAPLVKPIVGEVVSLRIQALISPHMTHGNARHEREKLDSCTLSRNVGFSEMPRKFGHFRFIGYLRKGHSRRGGTPDGTLGPAAVGLKV